MTLRRSRLMLAGGGLLLAFLATPAFAQSVDVDANGNVRVDSGNGTVVRAGQDGADVHTNGARIEADGRQDISSRSGDYRNDGDNVQRGRVDVRADGGVHVTGADGGRATTTVGGRTITSGSAAGGTLSYVNQDLDESNFSGRRMAGAAFVNSELNRTDFRNTILVGANFTNAELVDADFRGANLRNANLVNAELSGARFDGATWVDGRVCDSGSVGGCR